MFPLSPVLCFDLGSLEFRTILRFFLGRQAKSRIRMEVADILDYSGILKFRGDSNFPIRHRRFPRCAAELHECSRGDRAGRVNPIPAMNEDGLRFVFYRIVDLLVNGGAPPAFPPAVNVVKGALRAVDRRGPRKLCVVQVNCSPYAGIAERIELSPIKRPAPVARASTIKDSGHDFSVVTDATKLSPWLLRRSRLFGQVPGRNKLKAGSRLLVSPFPDISFISCCCRVL
jgi:hypothetical protein